MDSVGTQIRMARLQAGLSLEQVSEQTRISLKILQAIEEDKLDEISSGFFYKSFVKQFCVHIGLPADKLQDAICAAASSFPDPIMPGQGEAIIRSAIVKPLKRPRQVRWLFPSASLAMVLVACSGFYAYWENLKSSSLFPKSQPAHTSAPSPAKPQHPAAQSATASTADPTATVPAEPDGGFRVELSAVERTWLSIKADGKQVYAGTLEVDQTKVLEGHQEGQLRTGNAGGVNIVFNGKQIGLAGPHGSIRTIVFTRDNYEVLPDPVHTVLSVLPKPIAGWLRLPPAR